MININKYVLRCLLGIWQRTSQWSSDLIRHQIWNRFTLQRNIYSKLELPECEAGFSSGEKNNSNTWKAHGCVRAGHTSQWPSYTASSDASLTGLAFRLLLWRDTGTAAGDPKGRGPRPRTASADRGEPVSSSPQRSKQGAQGSSFPWNQRLPTGVLHWDPDLAS